MPNTLLERFKARSSPAKKLVSFLKTPFKQLPPGTPTALEDIEALPRKFLESQIGKEETKRFIQQEKALRPTFKDVGTTLKALAKATAFDITREKVSPKERAATIKTITAPIRAIVRPLRGIQAGVGAAVDIAKGKKKSLIKETVRGVAFPEEVKPVVSRIPFQEFEQGSAARLIPRAIAEAVEEVLLFRVGFRGIPAAKSVAGRRIVKNIIKKADPILRPQVGSEGIKIVERELNKAAGKLSPVELFKLSKKVGAFKITPTPAPRPISGLLTGRAGQALIPFEPGELVKFGKQTGKIIKISGTQALISSAGKQITKSLSELQPITPTPEQLKEGVIPAKDIPEFVSEPTIGQPQIKPPTPLKATPQVKAEAVETEKTLRAKGAEPTPTPFLEPTPEAQASVQKVVSALKIAKPIRAEQEKLFTKARRERIAKAQQVKVRGEAGFFAEKAQLRGELPKARFESIRGTVEQQDIDNVYDIIKDSNKIGVWEKINAREGLAKLFGQYGGQVPTKGELKLLTEIFGKEFTDTALSKRTLLEKLKEAGIQLANIPRSFMSSFDMSAPFRQGVFLMGNYPKQSFRAFRTMFRQFFSERAFQATQDVIKAKPTYDLMVENKLSIMDMDSGFTEREERFMSQWAEKIPVAGPVVRASGRAYTGYLNKVRADVFEDLVNKAEGLGLNPRDNPKVLKSLADFINAGTGRGGLGAFERAGPVLNTFFFSPKLMASRLQLLNPAFYVRLDPFTRREALSSLFKYLAIGTTILTTAKMSGIADVGLDPRSADFGKIKIGNTRIDVWGGFQQYVRLAAQLVTGEIVSSTSGKIITLGEGYRPLTRLEIIGRFFEYKEAPVASFAMNLLRGKTLFGEEIEIPKEIGIRFVPMVMQDVYDLYQDQGILGLPLAPLGWFGVGLQTYESKPRIRKNILLEQFRKKGKTKNPLLKKFRQR